MSTQWGVITGPPSVIWQQNFVTEYYAVYRLSIRCMQRNNFNLPQLVCCVCSLSLAVLPWCLSMSALGTTCIHFIEPSVIFNDLYYCRKSFWLMQKLHQQLSEFYVFQPVSASTHRSPKTVDCKLLRSDDKGDCRCHSLHTLTIKQPGLRPVDYTECEKVYKGRIKDVTELQSCILSPADCLDQRVIDMAVRQWRTRLPVCVEVKGRHFEQKLSHLVYSSCCFCL